MKKLLLVLAVAFVGVLGAQNIAHYSSQKVLVEYTKAKQATSDIEQFQNTLVAEIQIMQTTLEEQYRKLQQEGAAMSEWEREHLSSSVQDLNQRVQMASQQVQEQVYNKQTELFEPIYIEIEAALKAIAEAKKYDFILDLSGSRGIYSKAALDVTDQVIAKLGGSTSAN
jgi:outer membrane protein